MWWLNFMINKEEIKTYLKIEEDKEKNFINDNSKIDDYYKNILIEESHTQFEQVLESIQYDLKMFHTNLVYTEKIINFINEDFKIKGVFPQDLIFLNLFITNAVTSMILTTHKFALDKENVEKKRNGGLSYLRSLVNVQSINNLETKKIANGKTREVKLLFNKYEQLSKQGNISLLRNSKIVHYDVGKQDELENLKVDLNTLLDIYNVSVEIFEILSLKYFERISSFNHKMIKLHSFKNFICQNITMYNPNPAAQLDIERYFVFLRKNFVNSLLEKQ